MKKMISILCMTLFMLLTLVGCGKNVANSEPDQSQNSITQAPSDDAENTTTPEATLEPVNRVTMRIASLKGPTSLGLLQMMNDKDQLSNDYQFEMLQAADEIVTKVVKGEVDVALVPANVAAVLYQKTNQQIQVIDINTLGVLYVVEHQNAITTVADLKGKTICMTGKGTVPEFALSYILSKNGLSIEDVNVEFKSEPAEVIAFLSTDENAIGILPQPFATSAMMQDSTLTMALNLTEEWNKVDQNSTYITGVTIVRKEFLDANKDAVNQFLAEHATSVEYTNTNTEDAANLAETAGIVKAAVAKTAIPFCNIVCITGNDMQTKLSGYLQTLYDANADSVGGTLPDEGFYYTGSTAQ